MLYATTSKSTREAKMSDKSKSSSKTDSETSMSLLGMNFVHKKKQELSDVTGRQATSHAKQSIQSDSGNSFKLITAGLVASVVGIAIMTGGEMYIAKQQTAQASPQVISQVVTDLTQCRQDLATALITQKNNQELAVNLGINVDGMFNDIKVEIYDNRVNLDAQLKSRIQDSPNTASYIDSNTNSAGQLNDHKTFRSIMQGTDSKPGSLLEKFSGFERSSDNSTEFVCKPPQSPERNSCKFGDDPEDYDNRSPSSNHPVG